MRTPELRSLNSRFMKSSFLTRPLRRPGGLRRPLCRPAAADALQQRSSWHISGSRSGTRLLPCTRPEVVESNQIDIVTLAVARRLEQVLEAAEPGLARQILGDLRTVDGRDRVDDDVSRVEPVAAAHLDLRSHPDANAACDPAATDALVQ